MSIWQQVRQNFRAMSFLQKLWVYPFILGCLTFLTLRSYREARA